MTNNIKAITEWGVERGIDKLPHDTNGYISNIVEELAELKEADKTNDANGKVDALFDVLVFTVTEISKIAHDPDYICTEGLKEISSRAGAWDERLQKWQKFKTPEAMANWYKADYTRLLK